MSEALSRKAGAWNHLFGYSKKGLKAANGSQTLKEDYTFSFETSHDSSKTADPSPGNLGITDIWFDYSTRETPVIPFYLYHPGIREQKDIPVKAAVYRFANEDALIKAVRERRRCLPGHCIPTVK